MEDMREKWQLCEMWYTDKCSNLGLDAYTVQCVINEEIWKELGLNICSDELMRVEIISICTGVFKIAFSWSLSYLSVGILQNMTRRVLCRCSMTLCNQSTSMEIPFHSTLTHCYEYNQCFYRLSLWFGMGTLWSYAVLNDSGSHANTSLRSVVKLRRGESTF